MNTLREELTEIRDLENGVTQNKVANFAYTSSAYNSNDVNGVDHFDSSKGQNIPLSDAEILKTNPTVLAYGFRAQASALSRMLVNHFFGRISYNLNKVNDFLKNTLNSMLNYMGEPNGLATLDADGRIPFSQLPESAIEFKGEWDASTNTPALIDGTGVKGDMYYVTVAGTQDLGSGEIFFNVNDRIIYNGSVWQDYPSGSVKSVNGKSPTQGNVDLYLTDLNISPTDDSNILSKMLCLLGTTMLGKNWKKLKLDGFVGTNIKRMFYAKDLYILLVRNQGIYWSEDMKNWTLGTSDSEVFTTAFYTNLFNVNNILFASSSSANYWSLDGKTWTECTGIKSTARFTNVKYANGLFVGATYGDGMHWSLDGKTWTKGVNSHTYMDSLDYGNGIWVAGATLSNGIYWSEDGKNWTISNLTSIGAHHILYANGIWIASGDATGHSAGLKWSTDGKIWNNSNVSGDTYYACTYADNIYVAGARTGTTKWSNDGKTWYNSNLSATNKGLSTVIYSNGIWVAGTSIYTAGTTGDGAYWSLDGKTWTKSNITTEYGYVDKIKDGFALSLQSSPSDVYISSVQDLIDNGDLHF